MPATKNSITVDPKGMTVTVDVLDFGGTSITSYTASGGGTAHTLPLEISSPTTFHTTTEGAFTVTASLGGVQIMSKAIDARHGAPVTVDVPRPSGGAALTSLLADKAKAAPSINTQTDSYTLVLTDAGKVVELNKGTAATLTVPPAASVAFPTGTVVWVVQLGAGQVTLTEGAAVTISTAAATKKLTAQYSVARLYKRATNTWVASGDLAAS